MDISVIIVSYNVEVLLPLCIENVNHALKTVEGEVIVVDNNSDDDTVRSISEGFPDVHIIQNDENLGFAKGCHQGATIAKGEYLLFLNPDAFISKDYLSQVIIAMRDPLVGTITPILIDGSGQVLPESARVQPTSKGALKYFLGMNSTGYHASIPSSGIVDVEVASGACIAMSHATWERVGGFDERYFMYAEDIDLSLSVSRLGLKNKLLVDHPVVHIKGESTSKKGWNYNLHFFKSMSLFAQKHKGELFSNIQVVVIGVITVLLSVVSWSSRLLRGLVRPVIDVVTFLVILIGIQYLWGIIYFGSASYYHLSERWPIHLMLSCCWVLGLAMKANYLTSTISVKKKLQGFAIGWILSVVVYGLLPEGLRSSRMALILGGLLGGLLIYITSYFTSLNTTTVYHLITTHDALQLEDVIKLLPQYEKPNVTKVRHQELDKLESKSAVILDLDAYVGRLPDIIQRLKRFKSRVFWSSSRGTVLFADRPEQQSVKRDRFSFYNIRQPDALIQKRGFDILSSIALFPLLVVVHVINFPKFLSNYRRVLSGTMTIIGYTSEGHQGQLPRMKTCLLNLKHISPEALDQDQIRSYAMHYTIFDDAYYTLRYFSQVIRAYGG